MVLQIGSLVEEKLAMELDQKALRLDLDEIEIGKTGIPYYYWPINPSEISEQYRQLFKNLVNTIKNAKGQLKLGVDAAIIVLPYFLEEIFAFLYAVNLINKACADDYIIIPGKRDRLLSALLKNKVPPLSNTFEQWLRISAKASLPRKRWLWLRRYRSTLAIIRSPLINQYAKGNKLKYNHNSIAHCFIKLKPTSLKYYSDNDEIIAEIISALDKVTEMTSTQRECLHAYAASWLQKAFSIVDAHWNFLMRSPKKLPKALWIDDQQDIGTRILSRFVKKQKGEITSFVTGTGFGAMPTNRFEDCDKVVTTSAQKSEWLAAQASLQPLIQSHMPQWLVVEKKSARDTKNKKLNKTKSNQYRRPKIMYIPNRYLGEGLGVMGQVNIHDVMKLDFQVRLLHKIRSWNFEVAMNYRLESNDEQKPPTTLTDLFGSIISHREFDVAEREADIIIMDDSSSPLFAPWIKSKKPGIFIDFQSQVLDEHSRYSLNLRCPIVRGWYDEQHRAQVDWFELRKAILNCYRYEDNTFARDYLNQ